MTRPLLVLGLLLAAARPLAAQRGYWLDFSSGPGFGLTLPLSRHLDFEPGLFVLFNRSSTILASDSNRNRYRSINAGIAAALRWIGSRTAAVTPAGAVQLTAGKQYSHYSNDYINATYVYQSVQTLSPMAYSAGLHAGVQVRLSDRASLSVEHYVDLTLVRGTIEQTSVYTGSITTGPTSTRQSYRDTRFRNGFEWRVRIYRKAT